MTEREKQPARRSAVDVAALAMLLSIGVGFNVLISWPSAERALAGDNDFTVFYTAAGLVGSDRLWDVEPYMERQQQFGLPDDSLAYIRPPFYALLLTPLASLDYGTANWVWILARAAALALALWVWPFASRTTAVAATLVFGPLYVSFLGGQDVAFVVAAVAVAAQQVERRPWLSGVILSLAAIKFNLLLPFPILLLAQRRWRVIGGGAVGALALVALCFAAAGPSWLSDYVAALQQDIHPNYETMPSLTGLLAGLPGAPAIQTTFTVAALAASWPLFRAVDAATGFALAAAVGLVLAPHAYLADCLLQLPALTLALEMKIPKPLKMLAMLIIFPPLVWLSLGSYRLGAQAALVGFTAWLCWTSWAQRHRAAA